MLFSSLIYASDIKVTLDEIKVISNTQNTQSSKYSSSQILNRDKLDTISGKNKDIAEALKSNPNVIFNQASNKSTQSGEINPKSFSINGASFYQNNFLIDGVNFNNDIDPNFNQNLYKNVWKGPNLGSQAINLSTDLLENLELIDTSASAKYGDFLGGVINAKTRDPQHGFHGIMSFGYSSGKLSETFIDEKTKNEYKNTTGWMDKSDFIKRNFRFGLEGYVSENLGLIFDYTRRYSVFKNHTKPTIMDPKIANFPKDERRAENFYLKAVYHANPNLTIKPTFIYAPQKNRSFIEHDLNSGMDAKFGGYIASIESNYDNGKIKLDQTLNYTKFDQSRYFDEDMLIGYAKSDQKNWGASLCSYGDGTKGICSYYGGLGDLKQFQSSVNYKFDLTFDDIKTGDFYHTPKLGFDLSHTKATYKVANPVMNFTTPKALPNSYICQKGDKLCINDSSFAGLGQYLSKLWYYGGVNSSLNMNMAAFYIEDDINYKRLYIRPGIRIQKDSITDDINLAPRFVGEFDLLNDNSNFVGFGLNRYYGRNLFAYKLYNDMYSHQKDFARNHPNQKFIQVANDINNVAGSDYKTPYDDELSLFYRGEIYNANINLKYTKRKSKDEIIQISRLNFGKDYIHGLDRKYNLYTNDGKSDTDILSFSIQNSLPIEILTTKNNFEFSLSYMDKKSNFSTYYDKDIDKNIVYNGRIVPFSSLPVTDYYTPFRANLAHNIKFNNFSITNFLSYYKSSNALFRSYNSKLNMSEYTKVKLDNYFTWDIKITYTKDLAKQLEFFANLDINNIFNDKHSVAVGNLGNKRYFDYDMGRNFWLEFGLKW